MVEHEAIQLQVPCSEYFQTSSLIPRSSRLQRLRYVQSCIELKNEFFIPITDVSAEIQQSSIVKNTEDWLEARQRFHVHMRNMFMIEDFVFVEEHRGIEIGLAGSPEMPLPYASRIIWIIISEEYVLGKEIFSLELLFA